MNNRRQNTEKIKVKKNPQRLHEMMEKYGTDVIAGAAKFVASPLNISVSEIASNAVAKADKPTFIQLLIEQEEIFDTNHKKRVAEQDKNFKEHYRKLFKKVGA